MLNILQVLYKILFLIKKTKDLNALIYITICDVIHLHVFRNRFLHMLFLCNFLSQRSVPHTHCVYFMCTHTCVRGRMLISHLTVVFLFLANQCTIHNYDRKRLHSNWIWFFVVTVQAHTNFTLICVHVDQ